MHFPQLSLSFAGFYRARKMVEGISDKQALDLAVDYEGKKIMRDKFSRSGVSMSLGKLPWTFQFSIKY